MSLSRFVHRPDPPVCIREDEPQTLSMEPFRDEISGFRQCIMVGCALVLMVSHAAEFHFSVFFRPRFVTFFGFSGAGSGVFSGAGLCSGSFWNLTPICILMVS